MVEDDEIHDLTNHAVISDYHALTKNHSLQTSTCYQSVSFLSRYLFLSLSLSLSLLSLSLSLSLSLTLSLSLSASIIRCIMYVLIF